MDNLGRSVKRVSIRARVLSKTFVHIRVSVYTIWYTMRSNHRCYVTRIARECGVKARKPSANIWQRFRLVACRLNVPRDCISLEEPRKELSCLPRDLNEVCERIFLSIPTFRRQAAIRIVQLLLYSSRPLKVSELLDAIAVDAEGDIPFDKSRWPIEAMDIAVYCSSLTVLVRDEEVPQSLIETHYRRSNNSEPVFQRAHFSVKEYLKSANIKISFCDDIQEQRAEQTFAEVCVTCLLRIKENDTAEIIRHQFPLRSTVVLFRELVYLQCHAKNGA